MVFFFSTQDCRSGVSVALFLGKVVPITLCCLTVIGPQQAVCRQVVCLRLLFERLKGRVHTYRLLFVGCLLTTWSSFTPNTPIWQ